MDSFFLLILIIVLILLLAAVGFIAYLKLKPKKKTRHQGSTVVIAGLSDAGKTCLFYQLTRNKLVATVTSMKENEGYLDINSRAIAVVDVPGHGRLRYLLDQFLPVAGAIVFVVDSTAFRSDYKHVAECLYDLVTNQSATKFQTPILIVCNKRDVVTAADEAFVNKTLLAELNELRQSRAAVPRASAVVGSTSSAEDDDDANLMVGIAGEPLKWQHLQTEVTFCSCSAKSASACEPVLRFVESAMSNK